LKTYDNRPKHQKHDGGALRYFESEDLDMAKRIFTSFAIEDRGIRDLLVGQRLHTDTPFEFTDMSVKEAWDERWKTQCRSRILGCDGVIGLITHNTPSAVGQLWELQCAYNERKPVLLLYGYSDKRPSTIPEVLAGKRIDTWTWDRIANFVNSV
jgi:hypothetical protein